MRKWVNIRWCATCKEVPLSFGTFLTIIFAPLARSLSSARQRAWPSLSVIFLRRPTFLDELLVLSEVCIMDKWHIPATEDFKMWHICAIYRSGNLAFSLRKQAFTCCSADIFLQNAMILTALYSLDHWTRLSFQILHAWVWNITRSNFHHAFSTVAFLLPQKTQNSSKALIVLQSINKAEEKTISTITKHWSDILLSNSNSENHGQKSWGQIYICSVFSQAPNSHTRIHLHLFSPPPTPPLQCWTRVHTIFCQSFNIVIWGKQHIWSR